MRLLLKVSPLALPRMLSIVPGPSLGAAPCQPQQPASLTTPEDPSPRFQPPRPAPPLPPLPPSPPACLMPQKPPHPHPRANQCPLVVSGCHRPPPSGNRGTRTHPHYPRGPAPRSSCRTRRHSEGGAVCVVSRTAAAPGTPAHPP